jgi:hypothetical protein
MPNQASTKEPTTEEIHAITRSVIAQFCYLDTETQPRFLSNVHPEDIVRYVIALEGGR